MNKNIKYIDKTKYKTKDEYDKAVGRQKFTEILVCLQTLSKRKFAL